MSTPTTSRGSRGVSSTSIAPLWKPSATPTRARHAAPTTTASGTSPANVYPRLIPEREREPEAHPAKARARLADTRGGQPCHADILLELANAPVSDHETLLRAVAVAARAYKH